MESLEWTELLPIVFVVVGTLADSPLFQGHSCRKPRGSAAICNLIVSLTLAGPAVGP